MEKPANTKHFWFQKGSHMSKEWTIMRPYTSGKDGFHKTSFGHCSFEAVGGTSHGCEEYLLTW